MDNPSAAAILARLHTVEEHRALRLATPGLADKVAALKSYQQRRFSHSYADLLTSPRYGAAARFFLDELYGPGDFARRDAQFARVVPTLVRLFPEAIVRTVATLGDLHALSEELDTVMAMQLASTDITSLDYVRAWQQCGRPVDRKRQIDLTLEVGAQLDRFTRMPMLRGTLHLMRAPARAAGLGELQQFLEHGFDTFKAMGGAQEFARVIGTRERSLAQALFEADLSAPDIEGALGPARAGLPPDAGAATQ